MAKGKGKGSQWERDVSRILTQWMSGQQEDLWLWRSPGSGSMSAKTVSLSNKALSGDIIALKPGALPLIETFSLELKNGYESACPFQTITKVKGNILLDFWTQCCRDAFNSDKLPMLIFKKKNVRGNPFLGLSKEGIDKYFSKVFETIPYITLEFKTDLPVLYMMELNVVLDNTKYWGNLT